LYVASVAFDPTVKDQLPAGQAKVPVSPPLTATFSPVSQVPEKVGGVAAVTVAPEIVKAGAMLSKT
jgi:hypothetical protein